MVFKRYGWKPEFGTSIKDVNQFPSIFHQAPTCEINTNLSDFLTTGVGIGWEQEDGAPDWLKAMCPEVVDHFNRFPMFNETPQFENINIPIQPTSYAAQSVCTIKVVKLLAASVQARVYLHAGSHLAAIIHGQPIPWDDDVDMWLDFNKKKAFLDVCDRFGHITPIWTYPKQVNLHCVMGHNAIKVWLQPEGAKKLTSPGNAMFSPFVDLFLFRIQSGEIQELSPKGDRREVAYKVTDYFPTQPFYFGGIYVIGPQKRVSENRYATQNCVLSGFNHRLEEFLPSPTINTCIDCHKLHKLFPFKYDSNLIKVWGNANEQGLFPVEGSVFHPQTSTTIKQRYQWFNALSSESQRLTNKIPNLNTVEIDNTISLLDECKGDRLRIIEFNAEQGRRWLESTELLKNADVIILHEMDIGMARSDQQHTTRLMAYYLGMNYAWGLEFVELTLGDKQDREGISATEENFHGLHGNAILSKCKIFDATILRNKVGPYFSKEPNDVNAKGLERRLGGRMIMLSRIIFNGKSIVIGNTHKIDGFREAINDYINLSPSIIAGDQAPSLCKDVGLKVIQSDPVQNTWPASCTSFGIGRGDIICSNMKVMEKENTIKPCVKPFGLNITLGDHALTGAAFALP